MKQSIQVTVNFKDGREKELPARTIGKDDYAWDTIIGEMLSEAGIKASEAELPWSSLVVTIVNDAA